MRKPLTLAGLLAVAMAAFVGFTAMSLPATGGAAAASPGPSQPAQPWCNFVVAGKDATADGSVLMGYNNDWSANNAISLEVVPAPDASSYRYIRIMAVGGVQEGGINEHQLGALYGTFTDLDAAVLAADPYVKKGYGGEIWEIMLQQCRTAEAAIDLLEQMALTKGFEAGAAGSLAVADSDSAWVFELLGGHHWVAQRVADNAFLSHPNMLVVRAIDLGDPANFRGSADLVSFAQSIGRYDPSSGPFDVAWAYADRASLQSYYNTNRMWGAFRLVAPSQSYDPSMPFASRPVMITPDHPLTRQDIMAIDRYHYEGTGLDQTQGYALMSPHEQTNRPICYSTTDYGSVWQLRDWLPDGVGGVLWVALSRPCSSTFVPFYAGITGVPSDWQSRSAFSAFKAVADKLDKNGTIGGLSRYGYYIPLVHGVYGAYEAEVSGAQASVEAAAVGLSGAAREAYLTSYTAQRAGQAVGLAESLPAQMP